MNNLKPDIRCLKQEELQDLLVAAGEKGFRAQQIFNWVQAKAVSNWNEMTNIGKSCQGFMAENYQLMIGNLLKRQISRDGTNKFLWELADKNRVESVLLRHDGDITRNRNTVCLSTQIGCPMGCVFCATGKLGLVRNMTAGEILGQVLDITRCMREEEPDFKVDNLVYMGMGEPLLNLPAVLKSIRILNHENGQRIGMRRITLSTCGLVPQIRELAEENLDIVLAVSLHAADNNLRNEIMPVNRQYPLEELLGACQYYQEKTGRRITFEYVLVKGFNDSQEQADKLARLISRVAANVNVIPLNKVEGEGFKTPGRINARRFLEHLRHLGINAVLREEKGSDIDAACGQLAARES